MTDDEIVVSIQIGDDLNNQLKIRDKEDLQVAIETLQLADRYKDGEEFSTSNSDEEIQELMDYVKRLEEELNGVEEDVGTLIKEVSETSEDRVEITEQMQRFNTLVKDFLKEKNHHDAGRDQEEQSSREMKKSIAVSKLEAKVQKYGLPLDWSDYTEEVLEEMQEEGVLSEDATVRTIEDYTRDVRRHLEESLSSDTGGNGDSESSSPTDENKQSEDELQDQDVENEKDEGPDLSSKTIPEIVDEQLVEVESPPYSYDEFKNFSYTEQQAAIYAKLLLIQPATKEEVAEALIEEEPGTAETQYIYQRLDDLSPHVDKRRRPSDSPRDPYEYAGEGFDFDDASNSVDSSTEDEKEHVDDSPDQQQEGAYSFEWKTVDEAIDEYKADEDKKYLLCIRSMSSFTSPMMAENHSEEGEGAVWTASEELPDDFVK